MAETEITTKMCSHCKKELPVSMFHKSSSTSDGYQYVCKNCNNEMNRERYKAKRAKIAEANFKANLPSANAETITLKDGSVLRKVEKPDEVNLLSTFSSRQLFAEIKRRGYQWASGSIWIKQTVEYDKI